MERNQPQKPTTTDSPEMPPAERQDEEEMDDRGHGDKLDGAVERVLEKGREAADKAENAGAP